MKKFLSLVLALVLVCSMATVAFAAQTITCPYCNEFSTTSEAEYNLHISEGVEGNCLVKYHACQYGCGKGFVDSAAHERVCPEGSATCDYCGETFCPVGKYDDHLAACKEKHFNIPFDKIGDSIANFLTSTNWNDIITKIVGAFQTIVEKISGLIK